MTYLLHGNYLRSFPDAARSMSAGLNLISIRHSLWSRECENCWMQFWLISIKDRLIDSDDILCDAPDRLRGRNLIFIPLYDDIRLERIFEKVRKTLIVSLSV